GRFPCFACRVTRAVDQHGTGCTGVRGHPPGIGRAVLDLRRASRVAAVTTTIEYFVMTNETLVFVIEARRPEPRLVRLDVGKERVRRMVRAVRHAIDTGEHAEDVLADAYDVLARTVIDSLPDATRHLVLVPHDELHHLPFAALR